MPNLTSSQIFLCFIGAASFGSLIYFFSKLKKKKITSPTERRLLISKLKSQKEEVEKELEWLLSKEKTYAEEFEEENKESLDYSLPVNDPALKTLIEMQKIPLENQKMKTKILLLGDYQGLQIKDYDENYSIYLKNKEELKIKLKKMKDDGINELQIVSDYDYTTSCFNINNESSSSLFGTFCNSKKTSNVLKASMKNLYNRYSPAELDHSIELEERRRIMKEWHDTLKLCFINENLTIQKCLTILNEANLGLRYGYPEFLNICKTINLPYYMISGGMTEMLETVLAKVTDIKNYPNFFTFSNDMIFDRAGKLVDMNMKVYSTKKSGILDARKFKFKKNTLLFGDLITDYEMGLKMGDHNLIAIAFLEESKKQSLENYLKIFDIVIFGDGDFLLPDKILRKVGDIQENPSLREKEYRNFFLDIGSWNQEILLFLFPRTNFKKEIHAFSK